METRIRLIREIKGISQDELADKAGISRTTLSNLETGQKKDCNLSTLWKIANVLEIDWKKLL